VPTIWKTLYIFNSGRRGWSEVWYQNRSAISETVTPAINFATKRFPLLGGGAALEAIRISLVGQPQTSMVFPFSHPDAGGEAAIQLVEDGALYRVNTGSLVYRKTASLRAVPDDVMVYNPTTGKTELNPAWKSKFDAWIASMTSNEMNIRVRQKTGAGATETTVTNITVDGDGNMVFTVAGLVGNPGDKFTVKGATGPDKRLINGTHYIKSNNGTTVVTRSKFDDPSTIQDNTFGKARPYIIDYVVPSGGVPLRPVVRQTGRAFFVPAGRRPAS